MASSNVYAHGFDEQTDKRPPTDDCPECDGTLRTEGGETTCTECGLILDEYRFDHRGPRTFPEDDSQRDRTGAPLTATRHDRGLSTQIGQGTDANGNTLSQSKRRQLARLRREHSRAKWGSEAERNLGHGCTEIRRITAALGLSRDVREQACTLFRTAQTEGLLPGRAIESVAAACVYATCRVTERPMTLDDIAPVARCSRSRVANAYTVCNRELNLPVPPRRPRAFIPGLASTVDLPVETERLAQTIAERAHQATLSTGAHPAGFAAACLEVAAAAHGVDVRQTALADAAAVTPVTVRAHRDALRASEVACSR